MSDYIYNKVYRVPETLFLPTFLHENKIIVLWNLHENKIISAVKILKKNDSHQIMSRYFARNGVKKSFRAE